MTYKKSKHHLCYTIRDFGKLYLKDMKSAGKREEEIIPQVTYRNLMKDFFKLLAIEIIRSAYFFRIPYHLGLIRIRKFKTKVGSPGSINWKETRRLGKHVYHTNKHTDGYYFRWRWMKSSIHAAFRNSNYYHFRVTETRKEPDVGVKGLSSWIMECAQDPYKKDYDVLP